MTKSVNEIIAQRKAISHDTRYIGPLYLDKPAFKKRNPYRQCSIS